LMKSKGKDKEKDDSVPVCFPIPVLDEIQFNSDDSYEALVSEKKRRRYDQFHKTNNIILSKKYEKQVDSTSDKETGDEEYSFGDKEGFQSIDKLDDDELDLEDYDLPLNNNELFAAF
ncbi:5800_t:CDS:2, partial [Funneliformis caledonium]